MSYIKSLSKIDPGTNLYSAPAIILAVSILAGAFTGRLCSASYPPWTISAGAVASILAMMQPSPLAFAGAGFIAGIVLEGGDPGTMEPYPENMFRDMTLRGTVIEKKPSLYSQYSIMLRASEAMGTQPLPVNFRVRMSIPASGTYMKGEEVLARCTLKKPGNREYPPFEAGRTVADGLLPVSGMRSPVAMGRERILRALDKIEDGPGSAIFAAIALGQRWRVDTETREVLRKTGTYHLMAISGMHIGAAMMPLFILMSLAGAATQRGRPRIARVVLLVLCCLTIATYLSFAGVSSSAMRASAYFLLTGAASVLARSPMALVSLSWCVVIIVCFSSSRQPDISLLLSVMAVAGIVLSGRGTAGFPGRILKMTLGAVLFTLPAAVWISSGISVIAPIGNAAAAIPFSLVLVPCAVLADFAALFPRFPLEEIMVIWLKGADAALTLLKALADLPFSYLRLSVPGCIAATVSSIAGILVWRRDNYHLGVGTAVFVGVLILSSCTNYVGARIVHNDLVIDFPSVGQADAAIIRHKGSTILIDCGPPGAPGRDSPVAAALQKLGTRRIDAVFLSHLHPDHYGGVPDIVTIYPVTTFYMPEKQGKAGRWKEVYGLDLRLSDVLSLSYGEKVRLSALDFMAVGPDPVSGHGADVNRRSGHLLVEGENFRGLFTGDAGWDQVRESLSRTQSLDLLKVPHHGSKSGFPPPGLDVQVARLKSQGDIKVICPSDPPGQRPLPAPEVVQWFAQRGIKLVYTGSNGVNIRY